MDLLQNPFQILSASPRDDRRRIMELADEGSLLLDPGACTDARSALTNPRNRLSAEISWLPGVGPKRANDLLDLLQTDQSSLLLEDKLPPITRANLLISGLARLPLSDAGKLVSWILEIATEFENISIDNLQLLLNEDRVVAGFPEISDRSALEAEIRDLRRSYLAIIKNVLDKLPSQKLVEVVTEIVDVATVDGKEHGPILVTDLVDVYEVNAQEFLNNEEENIKVLVGVLQDDLEKGLSDQELEPKVNQLIDAVKNWDFVAQPIQVSSRGRGLDHDASHSVAYLVRGLAISMFNEYDKLDFSKKLTQMLKEAFVEVDKLAERASEDTETLEDIAEERVRFLEKAEEREEEWRKEITYEAEVGLVFKDKLSISPEGIHWKGKHWELESISWVRWGGTSHSVNGIPTGTSYTIRFGNRKGIGQIGYGHIELKKKEIFANFIERLWKAVGIRLLTEFLEEIQKGEGYRIDSTIITDTGVQILRKKLFGKDERVFCLWSELRIWNGAGVFCIGKQGDKKLAVAFSYLEDDNIHVIESAIRMFFKKGGTRLSSILDG